MDTLYQLWVKQFELLEPQLNALDAATGDGDHGTTMLRGLRAVAAEPASPVKAFRRAAGGASGSLFSLMIGAIDKVASDSAALPDALSAAAERISQIGQAVAGDKTMLDALIPASREQRIEAALSAARKGYESTLNMAAKRGRARYVEGAGVGHLDAGAMSVVALLETFAQYSTHTHVAKSGTSTGSVHGADD